MFLGTLVERKNSIQSVNTRLPWESSSIKTLEFDIVSAEIKRTLIDFTSNNFLSNLHFPPNMTFLAGVSGRGLFIAYCFSPGQPKPQFPSLGLMNTGWSDSVLGFQSLHSQTHLIYFPLSKCDKMEILAEGDRGISPSNFTLHWFSIRLWFGQLHHHWNWICWFAGGSRYCLAVLLDQDKCNVVYRWILSVGLARVEISENWWYMT